MTTEAAKLSTGVHELDVYLDGGLTAGEVTNWTGLHHNYRTGTALNLLLGAVMSNPPMEGQTNLAVFYNMECDEEMAYNYLFKMFHHLTKIEVVGDTPTTEDKIGYVNRRAQEYGWKIKVVHAAPGVYNTENVDHQARSRVAQMQNHFTHYQKEEEANLKLVLIDNLDQLRGNIPQIQFIGHLNWLVKQNNAAHLSAFGTLTRDANSMYRDVNDPEVFLKVVARTGYVSRALTTSVDRTIVFHITGKGDKEFTVGYHMANADFGHGLLKLTVRAGNCFEGLNQ